MVMRKEMTEKEQLEFEEAEMLAIIEKAREIYANDITDRTENEYIKEGLLDARYRKQRVGEWEARTDAPGFVRCSVCKNCNVYDDWLDGKKWKYCPECGAIMEGAK
jgi:hypothetical protein